jgi:hypothetical protein
VRQRAIARCEYCRLPDFALEPEDFHVEHPLAQGFPLAGSGKLHIRALPKNLKQIELARGVL